LLDALANAHRRRRKSDAPGAPGVSASAQTGGPNLVELAYRQYHHPEGD